MFRLGHETMNVCQRNVARFDHVECIFQGFGSLVSLRLQKDGRAKCKQIWTNLSHWNTDGLSCRCEDLLFFKALYERSARETWHSYRRQLLLHNDRVSLREAWLSVWRCFSKGKTLIDILAEILILLIFSNKNYLPQCHHLHTSMLKGESHVSRNVPRSCVINYVTFSLN